MFFTLLNYIQINYIQINFNEVLPTHIKVQENENKEDLSKENILITNSSTTIYKDIESGLIKNDFFDTIIKNM